MFNLFRCPEQLPPKNHYTFLLCAIYRLKLIKYKSFATAASYSVGQTGRWF